MSKITFNKLSINKLKQYFDDRVFAIPELQRRYVWDKGRVCQLLDSIYNHYPIGVSLIWKASSSKSVEIKTNRRTIIPPYSQANRVIEFIIDGQQRLSSLYGVLHSTSPDVEANASIDFTKIYFDLDKFADKRFIYSNKLSQNAEGYIRVCELVNTPPYKIRKRYNLNSKEFQEARKCYEQLNSYQFHFLIMETNSLEEVRETFIRINSQGMTVSRADALFAKTTRIGLRDLVESTRRSLSSNGFHNIKFKYFIYTLALANDETRIGAVSMENFHRKFEKKNIGKTEFQRLWKRFDKAFTEAKDYLQLKYSITQYSLLPSDNIYTMLSVFFYLNNKKRLSTFQRRETNKWFWHTVIGERYSGAAFNRNIPSDLKFFKQLAKRNVRYQINQKVSSLDFLKKDYRSGRSSSVAGYFLFLRMRNPRYLENGDYMILDGAAAIANRKDKHHIFPQDLLRRKGINNKWIHSIANICLLAANENQRISNNHPKEYLKPHSKKRFFNSVLNSHYLPIGRTAGFWNTNVMEGFKSFLNERGMHLLNAIEQEAGFKKWQMFEKIEKISKITA